MATDTQVAGKMSQHIDGIGAAVILGLGLVFSAFFTAIPSEAEVPANVKNVQEIKLPVSVSGSAGYTVQGSAGFSLNG